MIDQKKYFVLHAPRQTGKTTCLKALMDYLNAEGTYRALYINVESAQGARENVPDGMAAIYYEYAGNVEYYLGDKSWLIG
jgi:predicted AAA+ superfamily ATPase